MKKSQLSLFLLFFIATPIASLAQRSVEASEIIRKVEKGESVSYEDVTITGDLDFTFYFEKKNEDKYSRKKKGMF